MRIKRNTLIFLTVGIIIIIGLGLRVWLYLPEELPGGPHLDKIERIGKDYSLYIRKGSKLTDIVNLEVFEDYSPSTHYEFQESIENRPSKFVKDDKHHYYAEYIAKYGRMQFHSGYHEEEGISEWIELLPDDLSVDSFFKKSVAIAFDLSESEFKVYIPIRADRTYMTVIVSNRKIERIFWIND